MGMIQRNVWVSGSKARVFLDPRVLQHVSINFWCLLFFWAVLRLVRALGCSEESVRWDLRALMEGGSQCAQHGEVFFSL